MFLVSKFHYFDIYHDCFDLSPENKIFDQSRAHKKGCGQKWLFQLSDGWNVFLVSKFPYFDIYHDDND